MSVIAKLMVRNVVMFGKNRAVDLGCVCDNDLMYEYAGSEEDKLFTRYSPWGEMRLHQPEGWALASEGDQHKGVGFYVMILAADEVDDIEQLGAVAYAQLRVVSITDFGDGQAQKLEMCDGWQRRNLPCRGIENFNWKMSVDNPAVIAQIKPGTEAYWIAFYPADLGRDGAIAKAHGRASVE